MNWFNVLSLVSSVLGIIAFGLAFWWAWKNDKTAGALQRTADDLARSLEDLGSSITGVGNTADDLARSLGDLGDSVTGVGKVSEELRNAQQALSLIHEESSTYQVDIMKTLGDSVLPMLTDLRSKVDELRSKVVLSLTDANNQDRSTLIDGLVQVALMQGGELYGNGHRHGLDVGEASRPPVSGIGALTADAERFVEDVYHTMRDEVGETGVRVTYDEVHAWCRESDENLVAALERLCDRGYLECIDGGPPGVDASFSLTDKRWEDS